MPIECERSDVLKVSFFENDRVLELFSDILKPGLEVQGMFGRRVTRKIPVMCPATGAYEHGSKGQASANAAMAEKHPRRPARFQGHFRFDEIQDLLE